MFSYCGTQICTQCRKWGHTEQSRAGKLLASSSGSGRPGALDGMVGTSGCQGILLAHIQLAASHSPQIPFHRASLQLLIPILVQRKKKKEITGLIRGQTSKLTVRLRIDGLQIFSLKCFIKPMDIRFHISPAFLVIKSCPQKLSQNNKKKKKLNYSHF